MDFRNIELCDKGWVDSLLAISDFRRTEYCFTSLYMWAPFYNTEIAKMDDLLLVRSIVENDAIYVFPAGRGDLEKAILSMERDAERSGKRFVLSSLSAKSMETIKKIFPDRYEFHPNRDTYDYIYETEKLISLKGKKYQPKRNFIARFKELPDWSYEPISAKDSAKCASQLKECLIMTDEWCRINECIHDNMMNTESCAVRIVLRDFTKLNVKGALLRVAGNVVAYTIGERLNSDTFIIHIEKAFSNVKGAYPMINCSFLTNEASSFKYVNREDDAGDEGLRTAKLSYNPIFLEEKYLAVRK